MRISKKIPQPITKTIKDASEDTRETMTESSKENNKALESVKNELLNIMKDMGILES